MPSTSKVLSACMDRREHATPQTEGSTGGNPFLQRASVQGASFLFFPTKISVWVQVSALVLILVFPMFSGKNWFPFILLS